MRRVVLTLAMCLLPVRRAQAQACAATPEAAARSAIAFHTAADTSSANGYRAEDIQVDAMLHRAWVRVRRCDAPLSPVILVPFTVPMQTSSSGAAEKTSLRAAPVPPPVLVHVGDSLRVLFVSASVHMELEATAMQQGSEGQTIALVLKRSGDLPDEPAHRIHGTVRADRTVEVTP